MRHPSVTYYTKKLQKVAKIKICDSDFSYFQLYKHKWFKSCKFPNFKNEKK